MINHDSRVQWYCEEMNIISTKSVQTTFNTFSWMFEDIGNGDFKIDFEKHNYVMKITDLRGWTDVLSITRFIILPDDLYSIKRDTNKYELTLTDDSLILCLNSDNSNGSIKNTINNFTPKEIISLNAGDIIHMGVEDFTIQFIQKIPVEPDCHQVYKIKTKSGSFNTEGFRLCCTP